MPPLTNHCTHCENSHCQCRQPSKVFLATLLNRLSWRQASVNTITDSAQANERLFAVRPGNFIIYHTTDMDFLIETCEDVCSFSRKSTFQLPENSASLIEK
jgi:histidinol phosphatase-like enzyme